MFLLLIIYLHSIHMQSCDFCVDGPLMGEDSASSKVTWQSSPINGPLNIAGWKMDLLKMFYLLKMGILHCHVSLPECKIDSEHPT